MCSCNDEGVILLDDYIVKDTTQYTLEQTEWNLVLFVDAENNTSREPIKGPYLLPNSYTLSFHSAIEDPSFFCDTTYFTGMAHINSIEGCYSANNANSTIQVTFLWGTAVHPNFENDEANYCYGIHYSTEFEITATQLKLFYNDRKNYLLFKRVK